MTGTGFHLHRNCDHGQTIGHGGTAKPGHSIDASNVQSRRILSTVFYYALLLASTGCCCARSDRLRAPALAKPIVTSSWSHWWLSSEPNCDDQINEFEFARVQASVKPTHRSSIAIGESAYHLAERLHAAGDDRAVDYWARTIAWMDDALAGSAECQCRSNHSSQCNRCDNDICRIARVRQSAMIRTIAHGPGYGRLAPSSHLMINGSKQTFFIPIVHQGFAWNRNDFDRLLVFEPLADAPGNVCGPGVPLVVLTQDHPGPPSTGPAGDTMNEAHHCIEDQCGAQCDAFLPPNAPFAATALIKLSKSLFDDSNDRNLSELEIADAASFTFINPLEIETMGDSGPIAQSPAMALSYARQQSQYNPVTAFISGDNGVDEPRLFFLEPYQTDKTPLILVHGLISAPATFLEMADVVRADPVLRRRYQIWIFRYPTGDDFLESAAALRQQLTSAFACRNQHNANHNAKSLNNPTHRAVIVGHSMGGLVAKLQITESGDRLWRSVSHIPLEQLQGPPAAIADFRRSFFFQADSNIGRVVYIATPHEGSPWASRCVGRLAAKLARGATDEEANYEAINMDNPGAFKGRFEESLPTSIDLLRPNSQLLLTLASTASVPDVRVHSIIGDHCRLPRAGRSDGVVPIDSAYRSEAETTKFVDATHTSILRSPDAEQELLRILRMHLETSLSSENECPIPATAATTSYKSARDLGGAFGQLPIEERSGRLLLR